MHLTCLLPRPGICSQHTTAFLADIDQKRMGQTREKKPSKRTLKAEVAVDPAAPVLVSKQSSSQPPVRSIPTTEAEAEYDPSVVEVRYTENKGYALFATRRIPPGTLILQEEPLIRLTRDEEVESNTEDLLVQRYNGLHKNIQRQYKQLHDSKKSDFSRTKSIYFSNCYNLNGDRSIHGGSCIGSTASRINHSCIPNVQFSFTESDDSPQSALTPMKMMFHAIKPIAKDKEILSNYENIFLTSVQRRQRLQMYYGFQCDCEACSGSVSGHPFWASSDHRRRELVRLKHETDSAEQQKQKQQQQNELQRSDELENTIASLQRVEVLLVKEGLCGDPVARVYADLARWSVQANRPDEARKWLGCERRVCVMGFGVNSRRARDTDRRIAELS